MRGLNIILLTKKQPLPYSFVSGYKTSSTLFSVSWKKRKERELKMVGEFMVCVDRILASGACQSVGNGDGDGGFVRRVGDEGKESSIGMNKNRKKVEGCNHNVIECRICQEEGDEAEMEAPCACNGTLKFAHRKCIQKWCNKKGDTTCEICNQVYAPNYTAPTTRASSDAIAIDIRQGWGAPIDLHDSHFLAIAAAAEQELLNAEIEDYEAAHNSGMACCRSVALVLMMLLLIRHILVVIMDPRMVQDASEFFNLSLQFASFLLPCYLIVRSCYILQNRRRRQV